MGLLLVCAYPQLLMTYKQPVVHIQNALSIAKAVIEAVIAGQPTHQSQDFSISCGRWYNAVSTSLDDMHIWL